MYVGTDESTDEVTSYGSLRYLCGNRRRRWHNHIHTHNITMNCIGFSASGRECGSKRSSTNPFFCGKCSAEHVVRACFLPDLQGQGGDRVLVLQKVSSGETASYSWRRNSPSWPSPATRMHPSDLIKEAFGHVVENAKNMWPDFLLDGDNGEAHYTPSSRRGAKGWNNRVPSVTFSGRPVGDVARSLAAGVAPDPGLNASKTLARMKLISGGASTKRPLDLAPEEDSKPVSKKPFPSREEFEHVRTEVARIAEELLRMGNAKDDRETKKQDTLIESMNKAKAEFNGRLENLEMTFDDKFCTIDEDLESNGEKLDKCMRNMKTLTNKVSELESDLCGLQGFVDEL